MRPTSVTHRDVFYLIDGEQKPILMVVTLTWLPQFPHTVTIQFGTKKKPEWVIGRQLLADGLEGHVGGYDITIRPSLDKSWIELHLDSPTGHAEFLVYRQPIIEFLEATWAQIPAHEELVPTDEELQRLTSY